SVAYQPIVDASGKIMAMEALSRWTHPTRGPIPPGVFIPLAEETDLISPLGGATFRQICRGTAHWGDLRVSINVSPMQLKRAGFLDRVTAILEETGAPTSRFDVEITEG